MIWSAVSPLAAFHVIAVQPLLRVNESGPDVARGLLLLLLIVISSSHIRVVVFDPLAAIEIPFRSSAFLSIPCLGNCQSKRWFLTNAKIGLSLGISLRKSQEPPKLKLIPAP